MLKPIKKRKSKLLVWVLADDRAGNVNQALGVAENLSESFTIKNIEYNELADLPNWIRGKTLIGVTSESSAEIKAPWPDVVVGAGRKVAPIARYIKKQSGKKTLIVQIMNPGFPSYDIDMIAIPRHDQANTASNMLVTIGAPNRINEKTIAENQEKWLPKFKDLPSPRIAVLVGGDNKFGDFTKEHAALLSKRVNHVLKSCKGSALISTSRRTSKEACETIKENIQGTNYFYDVDSGDENPYMGIISVADAIIVSGDSVSMCSEACSTGKPVYIFRADNMISEKHKRFTDQLVAEGYAHFLTANSTFFNASYSPLREAKRIVRATKKMLDEV